MKTYEETITDLVETCLVRHTGSIESLFEAIGCPYVIYDDKNRDFTLKTPPPPPAHAEPLVRSTLVRMLREKMRTFGPNKGEVASIFAGLCERERWRECLERNDDAYALAIGSACFILVAEAPNHSFGEMLILQVTPLVRRMLNQWISPVPLLADIPDAHVVARLLFGDAWCALVLGDAEAPVFSVIRTHRPAFMPGLLPAHLESESVVLPSMEAE